MRLSHIIKRLQEIKEEQGDLTIDHILSQDYPDEVCITGSNNALEFYQLPF